MLEELKTANKVVGVKQLRKVLNAGIAQKVFIADDADPFLTEPVAERCRQLKISVISVPTMKQLGVACGLNVGAAVAAIL